MLLEELGENIEEKLGENIEGGVGREYLHQYYHAVTMDHPRIVSKCPNGTSVKIWFHVVSKQEQIQHSHHMLVVNVVFKFPHNTRMGIGE